MDGKQKNDDAQTNPEILDQQELDRLDRQDDLLDIPRFRPPEQLEEKYQWEEEP